MLIDPEFRGATWFCIFLAIFNQLSGVNIVNMYSTAIINDMVAPG